MTKNEKCLTCIHRNTKGVIVSKTLTDNETKGELKRPLIEGQTIRPNNFCSFKQINLNNIIVKNCSSYNNGKVKEDLNDEFTSEEIFKTLPQQKRINFFK